MQGKYYQIVPLVLGALSIGAVAAILTLLPWIHSISKSDIMNSITLDAITDHPFRYSLLISIGVLIPFGTDQIFTLLSHSYFDIFNRINSLLLPFLIVLIQGFNVYSIFQSQDANYFWIYHIGIYAQAIALCNVIFSVQLNLGQKIPTMVRTLIGSTIVTNLGMICKLLHAIFPTFVWLNYLWWGLFFLALMCNLYVANLWYEKYKIASKTGLKNQPNVYGLGKIIVLIAFLIAFAAIDIFEYDRSLYDYDTFEVVLLSSLMIGCFYLIGSMHYLRTRTIAKFSMDALETKRAFVRYVSHEIRTPLNAATLGLQLLDKELHRTLTVTDESNNQQQHPATVIASQKKQNHFTHDYKTALVELVADVNQACNIAIEILNDLLLYEKIDGGLVVLDAQEVIVDNLVSEVLKLFAVQARALDIELKCKINLDAKVYLTIDKNKMSQVLRNLVSNALKFSKPNKPVILMAEIIPADILLTNNNNQTAAANSPNRFSFHSESMESNAFSSSSEGEGEERHHSAAISPDVPLFELNNNFSTTNDLESARLDQDRFMFNPNNAKDDAKEQKQKQKNSSSVGLFKWLAAVFGWMLERKPMSGKILPEGMPSSNEEASIPPPLPSSPSSPGKQMHLKHLYPNHNHNSNGNSNSAANTLMYNMTSSSSSGKKPVVDMLRIMVKDFGAGISKENQKKLFNEIVQFDAAKLQQGKGSGIGLWISNRIMQLHGGRIGVFSEGEGQGCTFYIDIPITKIEHIRRTNAVMLREMLRAMLVLDPNGEPIPNVIPSNNSSSKNSPQDHFNATNSNANDNGTVVIRRPYCSSSFDVIASQRTNNNSSSIKEAFQEDEDVEEIDLEAGNNNNKNIASAIHTNTGKLQDNLHRFDYNSTKTTTYPNNNGSILSTSKTVSTTNLYLSTKQKTRLLIIDDSPVNRKMLKSFLREHFDLVEEAVDGVDGINKVKTMMQQDALNASLDLESHKALPAAITTAAVNNATSSKLLFANTRGYDLIITDYFMPNMNGVEVVQHLRSNGYRGRIVGLTGNTESGMLQAFQEAGTDMVLIKPLQGSILQETVLELMARVD